VGVELVAHQHDPLGLGIVDIDQVLDAPGEVQPGTLQSDRDVAPAPQRLGDEEPRRRPTPDVLGVGPGRSTRVRQARQARRARVGIRAGAVPEPTRVRNSARCVSFNMTRYGWAMAGRIRRDRGQSHPRRSGAAPSYSRLTDHWVSSKRFHCGIYPYGVCWSDETGYPIQAFPIVQVDPYRREVRVDRGH